MKWPRNTSCSGGEAHLTEGNGIRRKRPSLSAFSALPMTPAGHIVCRQRTSRPTSSWGCSRPIETRPLIHALYRSVQRILPPRSSALLWTPESILSGSRVFTEAQMLISGSCITLLPQRPVEESSALEKEREQLCFLLLWLWKGKYEGLVDEDKENGNKTWLGMKIQKFQKHFPVGKWNSQMHMNTCFSWTLP